MKRRNVFKFRKFEFWKNIVCFVYTVSTMATRDRTFLEIGRNETDLINNLLLRAEEPALTPAVKTVKPEPGFCVKLKDQAGGKVFINICRSTELPPPKDIRDDELIAILESDDPSHYTIPMSLGEPRIVIDKGGKQSRAIDVIVNTDFYEKTLTNELFKTFMISVSMTGLDDKYELKLDTNDWVTLKNRKYFGEMVEVNIQQRPKSLITEIERANHTRETGIKVRTKEPEFTIRKEMSGENHPDSLLMEIKLPGIKCGADVMLDIGGDRIVMEAKSSNKEHYKWDVFLPVEMNPDQAEAQYDVTKQVLIVNVPTTGHKD